MVKVILSRSHTVGMNLAGIWSEVASSLRPHCFSVKQFIDPYEDKSLSLPCLLPYLSAPSVSMFHLCMAHTGHSQGTLKISYKNLLLSCLNDIRLLHKGIIW